LTAVCSHVRPPSLPRTQRRRQSCRASSPSSSPRPRPPRPPSNSVPKGASLTVTTTRRLSSSTLSPELLGGERRASAGSLAAPALLGLGDRRPSAGPSSGPGLTPTNTPANMNELLAPPPMPRRASTYHDTEKANSGELDNSGGSAAAPNTSREVASIPAPPTARWRNAGDDAGRRARTGRSPSSRRSRGSYRAPTPPWWTRSRDAGLLAEFFAAFLTPPPPPPPVYLITHYQSSLAAGTARGAFWHLPLPGLTLSGPASGRGRLARRARALGQKAEKPAPTNLGRPSSTLPGPRSQQGDVQRINKLLSSALPASSPRHGPERSSQRSTLTEHSCQVAADSAREAANPSRCEERT
jgi:hypothetical protein